MRGPMRMLCAGTSTLLPWMLQVHAAHGWGLWCLRLHRQCPICGSVERPRGLCAAMVTVTTGFVKARSRARESLQCDCMPVPGKHQF
jgi:hypothetical protein